MTTSDREKTSVTRRRVLFVLQAVAASAEVEAGDLMAPTRCVARVAQARQIAMYLTHVTLGLSVSQTARTFGRDRSTVAHACRVIEDQREAPRFDAWLNALEQTVCAFPVDSGPPGPAGQASEAASAELGA